VGAAVHLFISNFRKVSHIIWIFLLLFITYNIYVAVCNPHITRYQNQWQKNTSVAQDFIYGKKAESVIVGSSLSARLNQNLLPETFFNLSFSGGSVLTGLEIIKRTGYIPKHLYIETNLVFRFKSKKMLDPLFYPIWWQIKTYIPALQEKYQPLNVLLSKNLCSKPSNLNLTTTKGPKLYKDSKENINLQRFNLMMKQRKVAYKKPLYRRHLKDLKELLKYFKNNGTQIVFFEMPIDHELAMSPKAQERREIIKNGFHHTWLPLTKYKDYVTTDGHHLTFKSAYNYTKVFLNNTSNLK